MPFHVSPDHFVVNVLGLAAPADLIKVLKARAEFLKLQEDSQAVVSALLREVARLERGAL